MNTTLKRFTIFLALTLSTITASSQKLLRHRTPSSKLDSIPVLSNYQVQLVNLNFTSMMYWYQTANTLDTLYRNEVEKNKIYYQITGVQASSAEALTQIYENKRAVDLAIKTENEKLLNDLKKSNRNLKIGNKVLVFTTSALLGTTLYLSIFR